MRERIYEEERLLLHVQEALAEAIHNSGVSQSEIAKRLGKNRSFVTQALSAGRNLTIASIAALAWAAGHRIRPTLEPLVAQGAMTAPQDASRRSENIAPVTSIAEFRNFARAAPQSSRNRDEGRSNVG